MPSLLVKFHVGRPELGGDGLGVVVGETTAVVLGVRVGETTAVELGVTVGDITGVETTVVFGSAEAVEKKHKPVFDNPGMS